MKKIKIKYFDENIEHIEKIHKGDWIDLRAAADVEMVRGEFKMIPLGVAMELPKGFEALVVPRSSTFKNYGIIMTNSMGVIDNSYCGDNDQWHFPALCMAPTQFKDGRSITIIKKGDRICQFRIVANQPEIEFNEIEFLENENRGGFGTTGVE